MNYYLILINGALGGASLSSFDGPFASKEEAEEHKKTLHYGHVRIPLKVAGFSGDGDRLPFRSALYAFFYSSSSVRVNV